MTFTLADISPSDPIVGRRINVDRESRRISVRVARWDEIHSGFGEKVRIPRRVNVDAAHVGTAALDDGSQVRVATLPMDTMHAPRDLASLHAAAWYEDSGKGIARGRYSTDGEGVRFDGQLFEDVDDATVDRVLAASASGDWRSAVAIKRFSDFEKVPADFVGACIVNIPGYSDTFSKDAGQKFALVASAHTILSIEEESPVEDDPATPAEPATTVTASGDGCDGSACDACGGSCTKPAATDTPNADEPTVTITASALTALVAAADPTVQIAAIVDTGVTVPATEGEIAAGKATRTPEELIGVSLEDAVKFAKTVLTAGGHIAAPDPRDAKLATLERMVIDMAFRGD